MPEALVWARRGAAVWRSSATHRTSSRGPLLPESRGRVAGATRQRDDAGRRAGVDDARASGPLLRQLGSRPTRRRHCARSVSTLRHFASLSRPPVLSTPRVVQAASTSGGIMNGPYETERQALDDCRAVYDAMHANPGQMQPLNWAILEDACRGVELGEYDRRIIAWLAGSEPQVCQVIAEIVRRAKTT